MGGILRQLHAVFCASFRMGVLSRVKGRTVPKCRQSVGPGWRSVIDHTFWGPFFSIWVPNLSNEANELPEL